MGPAVSLRNLSVTLSGHVKALDNISLDITLGKITGFIGPSGAGKTTLIKTIVGRLKNQAGTVTVLGLPAGNRKLRSEVAYMSQSLSIYSDLTVSQNLSYFARMIGADKKDIADALKAVDLTDKANELVENLSGGQAQRVSLAIALVSHPHLLVLDEPTVGLDPALRDSLWKLFRVIVNSGTTIIISSHSMDEAERCDDLVLIRAGKVLAHSSPKDLLRDTKTKTVEKAFLKLVEVDL